MHVASDDKTWQRRLSYAWGAGISRVMPCSEQAVHLDRTQVIAERYQCWGVVGPIATLCEKVVNPDTFNEDAKVHETNRCAWITLVLLDLRWKIRWILPFSLPYIR